MPDDSPTADLSAPGARLPVSETQQPPRRQQTVAAAQRGGADGRMQQQPIVARREYADEGYREGRGPRDPRDAMYRERAIDERATRRSVDGSIVQVRRAAVALIFHVCMQACVRICSAYDSEK